MKIDKETGYVRCPFCGSSDISIEGTESFWTMCNTCGAEGPVPLHNLWTSKEQAVAAWNRRYNQDEDDGR